jgi:hypothetical protein
LTRLEALGRLLPQPVRAPLIVIAAATVTFAPLVGEMPRWKTWDFGTHHVLTREMLGSLERHGSVPHWLNGVGSGDSPYELYPHLSYLLWARLAQLFGGETAVAPMLAWVALVTHVLIAVQVSRLALRLAAWPIAAIVGLLAFLDVGSFESGGAQSLLEVGLLHAGIAQVLVLESCIQLLAFVRHPRLRSAAGIWTAAALAAASHPSSLLFLICAVIAALAVSVVCRDAPPRRLIGGALHLVLGVGLGAFVWLPQAERLLAYGIHIGYFLLSLPSAAAEFAGGRQPPSSFPPILVLGLLGSIAALAARRAAAAVLAATTGLLLLGFTDVPFLLLFDLAPRHLSRLQGFRFLMLVRPLLFVMAAALAGGAARHVRRAVPLGRPAARRALTAVALLVAILALPAVGSQLSVLRRLLTAEVPDREGYTGLVEWARRESVGASPGAYGRLLVERDGNWVHHVAAESGLPTLLLGDQVAVLLRERMEDATPESLRRFNVRWVLSRGAGSNLGEPGSERRFGSFVVREIASWDGRLARVERGGGEAAVAGLTNQQVELELRGTGQPALVALGVGYYPRWRATTSSGRTVPVFAARATSTSPLRVPAAWLPPGRTTFTPDASLPSDTSGRAASTLTAALLLSICATRACAPARRRWLKGLASLRRTRDALARRRLAVGAAAAAAVALGLSAPIGKPDLAFRVTKGLLPVASVEARVPDGDWRTCGYSWIGRRYECSGAGSVRDGAAFVLTDHPSSTPFLSPAVVASAHTPGSEFRVRSRLRLAGRYWGRAWGGGQATLRGTDAKDLVLADARARATFDAGATAREHELLLRVDGQEPLGVTLVRRDALDLDRTRDVPWAPQSAPQELASLVVRP